MKLCLVGGFLGSGKTTAILSAAKILLEKDVPVAIITNDQGEHLVDTALFNSALFSNSEVPNGCFCCNYEQFYNALLSLEKSGSPHIVFAEAVGSCTDLVATIINPLKRFDPSVEIIFSVFADGNVLIASLEGRSSFASEHIRYIYKKQLEEAGLLIVNKSDLLTPNEVENIRALLGSEYPGKRLLFQDSNNKESLSHWVDFIKNNTSSEINPSLNIDYEKYAKGEAALAWLDAIVTIQSEGNAVRKCFEFIDELFDAVTFENLAIGHLKFFLESGDWSQKVSYTETTVDSVSKVDNNQISEHARIMVNARIETYPDRLERLFFQSVEKCRDQHSRFKVENLASFQPGYPKPTFRFAD